MECGGQQADAGSSADAPSTPAKAGDLDRFGHRIPWATIEDKVPASQPAEHLHEGGIHGGGEGPVTTTVPAGGPARLSLGDVDRAARLEGLKPGYAIVAPVNTVDDKRNPAYDSYQLSNAWPDRLSAEQTVYLDQFSGKELAQSDTSSFGAIGQATELGVLIHMGTQFGVVGRIVMTTGVLLLLASIGTSAVMCGSGSLAAARACPSARSTPGCPRRSQ